MLFVYRAKILSVAAFSNQVTSGGWSPELWSVMFLVHTALIPTETFNAAWQRHAAAGGHVCARALVGVDVAHGDLGVVGERGAGGVTGEQRHPHQKQLLSISFLGFSIYSCRFCD